jgi:hypothetical protein
VLIAVLAAAFIGERITLAQDRLAPHGRRQGPRESSEPPNRRCRPGAARQRRPRSRASTRDRRCRRCRGLPRTLRRLVRHAVRWRRGDTAILTASGKGRCRPHPRSQRKTGSALIPIIHWPGPAGGGGTHALQPREPAGGETARMWIIDARMIRPQVDEADMIGRHPDRSRRGASRAPRPPRARELHARAWGRARPRPGLSPASAGRG